MKKKLNRRFGSELIKLHTIVFIFGFTAILGKLISISALDLVWYRMLIASVSFVVLFSIQKYSVKIPFWATVKILSIGLIVAAHWISFFGAIKLSNISVTLGCLASTTLFTSLLEPLIIKRKLNLIEVFIGLLIILGLYLIFRFETRFTSGILIALVSAFLAALFTVINKKMITKHSTRIITFYEMIGGLLGISIYLVFTNVYTKEFFSLTLSNAMYLFILGIVCTAFAFAIQVDVMKKLSAYVVALTINLEPIYGIILAYFIFGDSEYMSIGFYAGTAIILLSVFGYPALVKRKKIR